MRLEKKATIISSGVAAVLVLFKMTVGILSGSIALLASAIDSFLDLSISAFNYFALHNAEKPADAKFNFGRSKIEPLAAVIEGVIISVSALFILYQATSNIVHQKTLSHLDASIAVMLVSIMITAALVLFLRYVARKTDNMVIRADALHYQTDLLSNAAVLLALFLVTWIQEPIIDAVLGLLIALYMLYSAYPIIKEGILMLLDAALEPDELEHIKTLLQNEKETLGYHDLLTRRSASDIFISVHIVFRPDILLYDAHTISDRIEMGLSRLFPDKSVNSIVHMDPYDDSGDMPQRDHSATIF